MTGKKRNGEGIFRSPTFTNVRTYVHRKVIRGKMTTLQEIGRVFKITCKEAEDICRSGNGFIIEPGVCRSKTIIDLDYRFDELEYLESYEI